MASRFGTQTNRDSSKGGRGNWTLTPMVTIGIVLVNYCGASDTIACIKSIVNSGEKIKKDIVVIDNYSPSNNAEDIMGAFESEKYFSKFENLEIVNFSLGDLIHIFVIKSLKNGGFGYANNIGIRFVKYRKCDICVLLNNDTIIPVDFMSKIVSFLSKKNCKCAFSVLSRYYSTPTKIDSEGFGYMNLYTGHSSHHKCYAYQYLVGSCIIMNNVPSIPLFDEHFFLYSEDADYSSLLQEKGYILQYDSTNYFLHKVSASTSISPYTEKIKIHSLIYFMAKRATCMQFTIFCILRFIYYLSHLRFASFYLFCKNVIILQKHI